MDIRRLGELRSRIESLHERIQRITSVLEVCAVQYRNMPGSPAYSDRLSSGVAKLVDLKQQLVDEQIGFEVEIQLAEIEISKLPELEQRLVRLKYIHGLSYAQIAERENYSESYCKEVINRARKKLHDE
jgi:RNA polymerase sigma factor (sigma-70 family)